MALEKLIGDKNLVQFCWDNLNGLPGGKKAFSLLLGAFAPYTGTVNAYVSELREGYAKVEMKDRRRVRNHLKCIHAIALANHAEITGNIALFYSLSPKSRFIMSGFDIRYEKKARGTITGICNSPIPSDSSRQEYEIPVELFDANGDRVVSATLYSLVGPL